MAHHFGSLSIAALPANLLALPAVAPAMWLGMLSAGLAQLPWIPVEPLNWLNSLCLGYIAQVARWLGSPGWAQVSWGSAPRSRWRSPTRCSSAPPSWRWRRPQASGARAPPQPAIPRRALALGGAAAAALLLAGPALRGPAAGADPGSLVVRGARRGPGGRDPAGPARRPGRSWSTQDRLGKGWRAGCASSTPPRSVAVVLTHADSDHAGALAEVLSAVRSERVLLARPRARSWPRPNVAGVPAEPLVEGGELRSGDLRLSALWPPRELAGAGRGVEENQLSIVLLAEWRHFSMLLTGDAESEAVPLDPGPVDVIKLAHHGSADAGLGSLLERTAPHLAVISVGEDNPYGHPAPETMTSWSPTRCAPCGPTRTARW